MPVLCDHSNHSKTRKNLEETHSQIGDDHRFADEEGVAAGCYRFLWFQIKVFDADRG